MKKQTFVVTGVVSLILLSLGFVAIFFKQNLISLLLIAAGFVSFTIVLRKAKKEPWFGKPSKSFKT
jgi:membrane-bound ClpP family serine protease